MKKVTKLRMGGYAAGLPGGCFAVSASSAILQRSSSRTQWPSGPAMTPLRFCRGLRHPCTPRKRRALHPSFLERNFYKAFSWQCKAQIRHRGAVRPFPGASALGRISSSAMSGFVRLRSLRKTAQHPHFFHFFTSKMPK